MNFVNSSLILPTAFVFSVLFCSCNKDTVELPSAYNKIYGAEEISMQDEFVRIESKGLPDHVSVYYPTADPLYENFSGLTFGGYSFAKNPNSIESQNLVFKIPANPKKAGSTTATPLGPIGISLNGVPFFNQYAGPDNQELAGEMASFDRYYGHPQQTGQYHYHVEPTYLTTVKSSKSGLMGFLLDGFPVYGPEEEDGTPVLNSMLDEFHGHSHATIDYPEGIYHYHFTSEAPYLNGAGFYGEPGTVSQ